VRRKSSLVLNEEPLTENRVERRGKKWCVVHGHPKKAGSKTDKPEGSIIKCFDTKKEADAMHRAIMAQSNQNQYTRITFNFKADKARIRHDTMNGRDHLVVPCVMMTEGVHHGSMGPLFYPEDELNKTPGVWNMKPVVVYHPQLNGQGISACDPDIITRQGIGVLMNTRYDKGLKTECWLEEDKTQAVDDRVLEALEAGTMMEVSTGLFTDHDNTEGEWNGEKYTAVARNYRPDHLAILPDLKGACSIEDGAGLLRNAQEAADEGTSESLQALGEAVVSLARGKGRGVGGPRQGDGGTDTCVCPKCGATAKHERGTPCTNMTCPKCGAKMVGSSSVKNAIRAFQEALSNEMSHSDLRAVLEGKVGGGLLDSDTWVTVVYDDYFIYEKQGQTYYQEYEVKEEEVKLLGVRQEATKQTTYKLADGNVVGNDVVRNSKEDGMDKEKVVNGLIENEESPWTEEDRDMLMGLADEKLTAIVGNEKKEEEEEPEKKAPEAPTKNAKPEKKEEEKPKEQPAANEEKEVTVDEYIANAPEGMRDVLKSGLAAHQAEKAQLIEKIRANERNPFTQEQLESKDLDELKGLAQLAEVPQAPIVPARPSFAGQAPVPAANKASKGEEPLEAPTMNFGDPENKD